MRILAGLTAANLFFASLFGALLSGQAARADASADAEAAAHAYALEATKQLHVKVGETAQAHLEVIPKPGNHVSPEAPVSVSSAAAPQFDLPKTRLARADAKSTGAQGVEFSLPVVGKAKGQADLKATLVFYICVEKLCAHQKREISIPVTVE